MRKAVLVAVLLLVACDVLTVPDETPTPFVPTSTPRSTNVPVIIPTVPVRDVFYEAQVQEDIPHLNIRNSDGLATQLLQAGDYVTVIGRAETLSGLTVEAVSEEDDFEGWWCQIEPEDGDQWVACDLVVCSNFCGE